MNAPIVSDMKRGSVSTASCSSYALLFSVVLCITLIPGIAAAQIDATTTSTTSAEAVSETTTPAAPWYTSDWIGGDVNRGDFVIGPGRTEITLKPGETVTRYVTLTNRVSDKRTFELFVEDITGGTDGSSIKLLGAERGPYTLKDYISFPGNRLTLGLGERAQIPVTISIPADAEPGGKYGSVLITTVGDAGGGSDTATPAVQSPIIARLGTLFFVTVPGDVETSGETKSLSLIGAPWWYEKGPIPFGIAYENTGSIHLNPYGELRIKNMFGEEVGYVQLDPWFVLPKSIRTREVAWDREFLLGRYTATVAINRGYDDIIDERTVVFWVLPWKIVGGTFLVIFIIFFTIRLFFRTFEFKRK
jgi:hypothetical protein